MLDQKVAAASDRSQSTMHDGGSTSNPQQHMNWNIQYHTTEIPFHQK